MNVNDNTGTSFAAPQVTGLIAQLCQLYPSLLAQKPALIKAVLAASAVYRAFNTNGDDTKDTNSELFLMQGAGVENARAANAVLSGGKINEITIAGDTHYSVFTINIPSSYNYLRLAMSWLKNNTISNNHYVIMENGNEVWPTVTEYALADLKLELYYGSISSSTLVASSDTSATNLELLQYTIPSGCSGTYYVRIVNKSYTSGLGSQTIALAWY